MLCFCSGRSRAVRFCGVIRFTHRTASELLIQSFNGQPKAYRILSAVRLRLTVKQSPVAVMLTKRFLRCSRRMSRKLRNQADCPPANERSRRMAMRLDSPVKQHQVLLRPDGDLVAGNGQMSPRLLIGNFAFGNQLEFLWVVRNQSQLTIMPQS